MIKRSIGIDIDANEIRAVQMARTGNRFHVEKTFQEKLSPKTDQPSDMLHSLIQKHGFHRRATTAVSLSGPAVFFHITNPADTDFNDKTAPQNTVPDDCFPMAASQVIVAQSSASDLYNKKISLITAVLEKSLDQNITLLKNAHLQCDFADARVFALNTAVNFHQPQFARDPGIILYAGNTHTIAAVIHNQTVIGARNIPHPKTASQPDQNTASLEPSVLLKETELTWRSVFHQKIPEKIPVVLAGRCSSQPEIQNTFDEKLHCHISHYDASRKIKYTKTKDMNSFFCIAEGLALHALAPQNTTGPNFIKTRKQKNAPDFNWKKHLYLTTSLLLLIGFMWLGGLITRKNTLENKYAKMKNDINSMCRAVLPDQQNLIDELALAQLDSHLQSTAQNYTLLASCTNRNTTPLELLRLIWDHTPNQIQVQIDNMWFATDANSIHLEAHCDSFSVPDQWRTILIKAPQFNNVEIKNRQRQSDKTVFFAMDISLVNRY